MSRVLVIYGSEYGTTESVANRMVKTWASDSGISFRLAQKSVSGNEAAKTFHKLKSDYDVLVIVICSFGDGDPPCTFDRFLYELTAAREAGTKPFAGMQHAVLGFGDSNYETFQNCPRLVDKLMGECGSRRFYQRFEYNSDGDLSLMNEGEKEWASGVFNALQSQPDPSAAPVCAWAEKGINDTISPKSLEAIAAIGATNNSQAGVGLWLALGAVAAAALAFTYFAQ